MSLEIFKDLIDQYVTSSLSPENRAAFALMLEKPEYRALLEAELESSFMDDRFEGSESGERKARMNKLILERIAMEVTPEVEVGRRISFLKGPWIRLAAAAMVILALGTVFLFTWRKPVPSKKLVIKSAQSPADIAPGKNGAILTLADGSRIVLDSLPNEKLIQQAGTVVALNADRLIYQPAAAPETTTSYNMLNVPRGRQFQVVLPDGTAVWLNAASSLRYPTVFTGNERVVEMSGEAYFEVAHDASKPFIVKKGNTEIKVLGTHFNVNAYDDEDIENITLLEGSVSIRSGIKNRTISPGQQAQVASNIRVIDNVDVAEVVAWKDGKFQFGETADIKSVMHQIANWYDVDVVYKGTVAKHIGGTISRNVSLSQLLKLLQTTGVVRFRVEGRIVEVSPQ